MYMSAIKTALKCCKLNFREYLWKGARRAMGPRLRCRTLPFGALHPLPWNLSAANNNTSNHGSLVRKHGYLEETESDLYDRSGDTRVQSAFRKFGWMMSGLTP